MTSVTWSDEETRLREAICRIGKLQYDRNYIVASDGNISVRMNDGTLLITPTGAMKGFLEPQHMAHIDMTGKPLSDGPRPSSEVGIHLVSYQERPDIKAICHAHPPHAVAMTIAGIDLQAPIIPEVIVTIGGIPTAPIGTPGTDDLGETIRDLVRCSDVLMMQNHGSVTLGTNLMDAYKKLDLLEHTAKILWLAHVARGGLEPLPKDVVDKMLATRAQLGFTNRNTLENQCGIDPRR